MCWPQYERAIYDAGGSAVSMPLTLERPERLALAGTCDGVLLPGSPADVSPQRYGQERLEACGPADLARERCDVDLLEHVFATGKPLLGICYGTQSLNVFCGGTLLQDVTCAPINHSAGPGVGVAHTAMVERGSRLGGLVVVKEVVSSAEWMRLPINSSHHQAIGIAGEGLRVVARSPEDLVVEAVERGDVGEAFVLGVQWHPERTIEQSATSRALFASFVRAAAAQRPFAPEAQTA